MPNIDSYNILLGGYLKSGDLGTFDGVLRDSRKGSGV